jgi:hypothetical protein
MKLIAHRGNIWGKTGNENNPNYITEALTRGYDVEIDVWHVLGEYYLGHDDPQFKISEQFLKTDGLWCHAKNPEALRNMLINPEIHCFWHEQDDYTITSRGKIWIYPNKQILEGGIIVLTGDTDLPNFIGLGGVCSDYVGKFK